MAFVVRPLDPDDTETVIEFAVRAWQPVFASLQAVLGEDLFVALRGEDWRPGQAAAVRETINADHSRTWVGAIDEICRGFVTATVEPGGQTGEIVMVAVDPDYQHRGLATALTATAIDWLREQGTSVVMVETGGDPGHAAARATYERAGFTPLPVVRYFKTL